MTDESQNEAKTLTLFIENKPYTVKSGQNLLQVCLSLKFDLPYFCWHPALHSVGACRQCAVKQFKDETDKKGKIIMACMTAVTENMRISISDPEARAFRASVIEWLMVNHPHDCPVCDEGGECHLQDMTVMTGHTIRRTHFNKRTYRDQDLGPFIDHEMNRCIQCYRCVRYYRNYAGGRDLDVFGVHDRVYFGRFTEGKLESEFSGNLIEICPTGVFTDKTLNKTYTRKWDWQTAPSVCPLCGLGCNTIPAARYGDVRRVYNRYHPDVNGYFLCDRGRFGYGFVNSKLRIRHIRRNGMKMNGEGKTPVSPEAAMDYFKRLAPQVGKIMGIGSPRASMEANMVLRALVGEAHFYAGLSDQHFSLITLIRDILRKGPVSPASLAGVAKSDVVLILGEDVTQTAPMLALSLRQAVRNEAITLADKHGVEYWNDAGVREVSQNQNGPLYSFTMTATRLDDIARTCRYMAPGNIGRIAMAIAHELNSDLAESNDLSEDMQRLVEEIARELDNARQPLIVSGTGCGSETVIQAAANIALALYDTNPNVKWCFVVPECNSLGLSLLGPSGLNNALKKMEEGGIDTVIILETDLAKIIHPQLFSRFMDQFKHRIVLDHTYTRTAEKSTLLLPVSPFTEGEGIYINNEGRAQPFFKVLEPLPPVKESWKWLLDMDKLFETPGELSWENLDDIRTAIVSDRQNSFREKASGSTGVQPLSKAFDFLGFSNLGLGYSSGGEKDGRILDQKIARQSPGYSGRTAMNAHISVFDEKPPEDPDSPFVFSMEGADAHEGNIPAGLIPRYWWPEWNSVQALNKFQQEVGGPLEHFHPGIQLLPLEPSLAVEYWEYIAPLFTPEEDRWMFLPMHHIFGSEPLSRLSPPIATLIEVPYVGMNQPTMDTLGVREGEWVSAALGGEIARFRVKSIPSLPEGTVGIPVGPFNNIAGRLCPAWGRIFVNGENRENKEWTSHE
ncbi:MAG: NADH-quinone oxidoreductase subunit NuoG [Candidatus Omnitrophota bacterium]